jgi:hypothetical protein
MVTGHLVLWHLVLWHASRSRGDEAIRDGTVSAWPAPARIQGARRAASDRLSAAPIFGTF